MISILEAVLNEPEKPHNWLKVLSVFWEFAYRSPTDEERLVLERAKDFHGLVELEHGFDGPHRLPPDAMIRETARKILEKKKGF